MGFVAGPYRNGQWRKARSPVSLWGAAPQTGLTAASAGHAITHHLGFSSTLYKVARFEHHPCSPSPELAQASQGHLPLAALLRL